MITNDWRRVTPTELARDVRAVISSPRIGFLDNADMLAKLAEIGIPRVRAKGMFWQKSLTEGMEWALRRRAKYVLVVDFDTWFEAQDVAELYCLMERHPEVDALCPVQVRRGSNQLLLTPDASEPQVPTPELFQTRSLLKLRSGHFGLTLLRAKAFCDLPRPWMQCQPDPLGGWGAGSVDSDGVFWEQWRAAGHTVYGALGVVVGHAQLVVSWPAQSLDAPIHQHVYEYDAHGKPADAL